MLAQAHVPLKLSSIRFYMRTEPTQLPVAVLEFNQSILTGTKMIQILALHIKVLVQLLFMSTKIIWEGRGGAVEEKQGKEIGT